MGRRIQTPNGTGTFNESILAAYNTAHIHYLNISGTNSCCSCQLNTCICNIKTISHKDLHLLRYNAVYPVESQPMFRRRLSSPSAVFNPEDGGDMFL
jgi:hypothetical protein